MAELADEGVIKFRAEHESRALVAGRHTDVVSQLAAWREVLVALDVIGQDPARYGGAGFGNLSARIGPFPGERRARPFLISATQTGGKRCMSLADFCVVTSWNARENRVSSYGEQLPSSESLTHAAIYDLSASIRVVLHVHAPALFARRREMRLPTTSERVAYGTPEMADEVARLYRDTPLPVTRVLAMAGHEDGILAFGKSFDEAGHALVSLHARARALAFSEQAQLCRPQGA